MKDDSVFIKQILDSISKVENFVLGIDRKSFETDLKTQSAVIMQLLIIGEISKKVSDKTKNSVDLPWKDISGFRDVAIHNYFDIDLDIVWQTITSDLPILKEKLSK